jgi:hypothetical protein
LFVFDCQPGRIFKPAVFIHIPAAADSDPKATSKPPQSHLKATLKRHQSAREARAEHADSLNRADDKRAT